MATCLSPRFHCFLVFQCCCLSVTIILYWFICYIFLPIPPCPFPLPLSLVARFQSDKKGGSDGDPSVGGTLNRSFGGDEPPTTGNVQQEHVETYVKV